MHTGKPKPSLYAQAVSEHGGSLVFGVPTVWSRVVDDGDAARALASARLLVSGSAPLPVPVFDGLAALTGHQPVERYGSTESLITVSTLADGERRPGWVGSAADGGADPSGRRGRRRRHPMTGKPLGSLHVQTPDAVRRIPEPSRRHGRGARRRRLVPHRRRRGHRRRRHAPDRRTRVGRSDQDRRLPGRRGRDRDRTARPSRRRRRPRWSARPTTDLGQRIVAFVVGDAAARCVDRLCGATTFGAQAAAGGPDRRRACPAMRWARCSRRNSLQWA